MNSPPARTKIVNPTIAISATGSRGLLEPGASLMKLILKARLFNDLLSLNKPDRNPKSNPTLRDYSTGRPRES